MRGGARVRRFGAVAVCAMLAVGLVGGCDSLPEQPPRAAQGVAVCPDTYPAQPEATRRGALVPDGATDALLCVYPFNTARLDRTVPAPAERVTELTGYLNAQRPVDPSDVDLCPAIGHDYYQVVLGYPGDTHVVVWVDYPCGVGSSTGAFVGFDSMDRLLAFWPGG